MKFNNKTAEVFVPDGKSFDEALKRTTHMAISAHQDDIELMAYDGILQCFGKDDKWFSAVVITNGAGSPRDGLYANYSDEEMQIVRRLEQKKAAYVGEYASLALLDYPSKTAKGQDENAGKLIDDLKSLISEAKPEVIYTHNLADKHDTHVATVKRVIAAIRELPENIRPEKLYGCEVWKSLDWMTDNDKVKLDVTAHPNLSAALIGVFDSQICGGKRYDLATAGRRLANATYDESHGVDKSESLSYAMDLTPLIKDTTLDMNSYVQDYIKRFSLEVSKRIAGII
ncbi:MAG: PIG-L family deacetylase [Eubacteriales bacterium]|nr:PIG-L family deacetylase [Eubacteriales bacterium]